MRWTVCITAIALTLFSVPAQSEAPQQISWENLVPKAPPLPDPVDALPLEQRQDLFDLDYLRKQTRSGSLPKGDPMFGQNIELTNKLKRGGISVDALLQQLEEFDMEVMRRGEMIVQDLDQKNVRLAGYALPLEFSGTGVNEFLLVPYVGACIHVPPPPPNQIVFVRVKKPFKPQSQFTPVWVTGQISAKPVTKSLSLVDGKGSVHTGYSIEGAQIEIYKK
jgi:hypothetical protein